MMDGFGGQIFVIDFEKGRIIAIQAIHDNFNFETLVYDVLKNDQFNLPHTSNEIWTLVQVDI